MKNNKSKIKKAAAKNKATPSTSKVGKTQFIIDLLTKGGKKDGDYIVSPLKAREAAALVVKEYPESGTADAQLTKALSFARACCWHAAQKGQKVKWAKASGNKTPKAKKDAPEAIVAPKKAKKMSKQTEDFEAKKALLAAPGPLTEESVKTLEGVHGGSFTQPA